MTTMQVWRDCQVKDNTCVSNTKPYLIASLSVSGWDTNMEQVHEQLLQCVTTAVT